GPDRPFRSVPNPYFFGAHVESYRDFYGRRAERGVLLGHLAAGRPQNFLVQAPRRAGKTSLLRMVYAVLADVGRLTGIRDWFELPPEQDPALNRTVPVWLNLQGIEGLVSQPTSAAFYKAVLGALVDCGLQSRTAERLLTEPTIGHAHFDRALREIVQLAGG